MKKWLMHDGLPREALDTMLLEDFQPFVQANLRKQDSDHMKIQQVSDFFLFLFKVWPVL